MELLPYNLKIIFSFHIMMKWSCIVEFYFSNTIRFNLAIRQGGPLINCKSMIFVSDVTSTVAQVLHQINYYELLTCSFAHPLHHQKTYLATAKCVFASSIMHKTTLFLTAITYLMKYNRKFAHWLECFQAIANIADKEQIKTKDSSLICLNTERL